MGWFGDTKEEAHKKQQDAFAKKYDRASKDELEHAAKQLEAPVKSGSIGQTAKNYIYAAFLSPESLITQVAGMFATGKVAKTLKVSDIKAAVIANVVLPAAVSVIPTIRYNNAEHEEAVEQQAAEKTYVQKLLQQRESSSQKIEKNSAASR